MLLLLRLGWRLTEVFAVTSRAIFSSLKALLARLNPVVIGLLALTSERDAGVGDCQDVLVTPYTHRRD